MAWDDGLVGPARDIAGSEARTQLVLAGPGTGKSFALQRKVTRLLEVNGADPHKILVATFTRVAAADLKRTMRDLNVPGCEDIDARTLHSYCFSLLMRVGILPLLHRVPRALIKVEKLGWAQYEYSPLLADLACEEFGNKREMTERLTLYEADWAKLRHDVPGEIVDPVNVQFNAALQAWLIFHEAIVIGELVPLALRFLQDNPEREERRAYEHIIVDEYQDLNRAEQTLVNVLAENATLTVVGDEDQSIYGFKWAHPDGILTFPADHPGLDNRTLDHCRRCPTSVVAAANNLIRNNHLVVPGRALSALPGNPVGTIHNVQWRSLRSEVTGLARYIRHRVQVDGIDAGNMLVLCPSRKVGYAIRDALNTENVMAHSFYHEEALEPDEAKAAFCLLRLLTSPMDRVSLRYWLGIGSDSWLSKTYGKLRTICEETDEHPRNVLQSMLDGTRSKAGFGPIIKRFENLLAIEEQLTDLSVIEKLQQIFPEAPWSKTFRDLLASMEIDEFSLLPDVYSELSDFITQPEMPESVDFVRIMSLHKSKGLTAHTVIMCSLVDGSIPRYDDALRPVEARQFHEEQRRLFYVGLTRATDTLVLSNSIRIPAADIFTMRAKQDRTGASIPSPFLHECGAAIPRPQSGDVWLGTIIDAH